MYTFVKLSDVHFPVAFIFLAGMINCNQQIDIDTTVQQLNLFISSISFPLQNMFSKSTKNNVYPHKEIKVLSYYVKAVKGGVRAFLNSCISNIIS